MKAQETEMESGRQEEGERNGPAQKKEGSVEVNFGSYFRFLFYHKANCLTFPLALLCFAGYQLIIAVIFIVYSELDSVKRGEN